MIDFSKYSNEQLLRMYSNAVIRVGKVSVFMDGIDKVRDTSKYLEEIENELLRRLNNKDK